VRTIARPIRYYNICPSIVSHKNVTLIIVFVQLETYLGQCSALVQTCDKAIIRYHRLIIPATWTTTSSVQYATTMVGSEVECACGSLFPFCFVRYDCFSDYTDTSLSQYVCNHTSQHIRGTRPSQTQPCATVHPPTSVA
jgi:hypothetical protein